MKSIVSILFIFLFSMPAVAQINQDKALYEQKVIKYTKMKKTGTALAVLGGILFTTGTIVSMNSSITTIDHGNGYTETHKEGALYFGVTAFVLGMGGLGAGIPLAIVGSKSKRKYEAKIEALSFRIQASPKYSGLTLAYRF